MNDIHNDACRIRLDILDVEGRSRVGTRADDDRYRGDRQTQKMPKERVSRFPYRRKTSTMVRSAVQYPLQPNAVLISVPYENLIRCICIYENSESIFIWNVYVSCRIIYLYFWVIVLRMNAVCVCIYIQKCASFFICYIYINVYLLCCLYKMVWLCRVFRLRFVDRYGQQRNKDPTSMQRMVGLDIRFQ